MKMHKIYKMKHCLDSLCDILLQKDGESTKFLKEIGGFSYEKINVQKDR